MYIFKNAIRSIFRSKGRNVLIGIIALVIAASSCVALSIREASGKAETEGLSTLSVTATIEPDSEKIMRDAQNGSNGEFDRSRMRSMMQGLSLDELQKYSKASTVQDFYYLMNVSLNGNSKFSPIDLSGTTDTSSTPPNDSARGNQGQQGGGERAIFRGSFGVRGDFTVIGASADNALSDFVSGTNSITAGEMFAENTTAKHCVISEELAAYNSLKVGKKITLANPNAEKETYEFKIVGIYKSSSAESTGEQNFSASGNASNRIYTSYAALKKIKDHSEKVASTTTNSFTDEEMSTAFQGTVTGTYSFADAKAFETFQTEVHDIGLSDTYKATSRDVESYNRSLAPLNTLSNTALWFFIIVLGIGGVILIVLNIFNIRERKYEIGVLTAMGMKKGKVSMQFIVELFVVTFIAVMIGTSLGAVVSVPISNSLLQSQISATKAEQSNQEASFGRGGNFGGGGGSRVRIAIPETITTNYLSEIDSAINITVILQLMGIAVLLTILSSAVATGFVMRYEPLKILSNRD